MNEIAQAIREQTHRMAVLDETLQRLTELPSLLRQSLADKLWAEIPANLFEYNFSPAGLTQIQVTPATNDYEVITAMYTWVPAGATGNVQLGNTLTIPVPPGPLYLSSLRITLSPGEVRQLTVSAAGAMGLYLWASPTASYGKMPT